MIAEIEGVRIDQEQFPETYKIKDRIKKIAGQFKYPTEDLLQESMLLELQITGNDRIECKAGYIVVSLVHKASSIDKKHSRVTHLEDIPDQDNNKAFAVYIRKEIFPHMIVKDALDAIGRQDKQLQYMLTRRIQHEDKTWRRIHRMYFRSKNNTWFFNKAKRIKNAVRQVQDHYAGVMHETPVMWPRG